MVIFRWQRHVIRRSSVHRTQLDLLHAVVRRRLPPRVRRAAVMVEAAIVMSVFITLTIGAIDLQIGVYRYNTLSQAARHGTRQAMVHGALAAPAMTTWGPAAYSGTAGDGTQYATSVQPMLVGIPQNNVALTVEWLDGSGAVGKRVRYTLSTPYKPFLGVLIGYPTFTLKASSTMPIAH